MKEASCAGAILAECVYAQDSTEHRSYMLSRCLSFTGWYFHGQWKHPSSAVRGVEVSRCVWVSTSHAYTPAKIGT